MRENKELKKVLNPLDVLFTAFGAMIGWGWVVSSGNWISQAGVLGTIIGFVIGGIVIFFVGLTYSELTTAMPKAGGVLNFSYKAFGTNGSFICTWFMILSYIGVVCFEACSIPTVIQYVFPNFLKGYLYTIAGFDIYATWLVLAIFSALIITGINILGVKAAAIFQNFLTVAIGIIGLTLVAASSINGNVSNLNQTLFLGSDCFSILKGILSVAVIAPFFLFGFDVIPQVAEEINVPRKKIGKLMLLSIILAIFFYALVVFAVGYIMNLDEINASLNNNGLLTADAMAKAFSSSSMAKILIIGGICGIITSWNSFLMGGSRAIYSMSQAHMIPFIFSKLSTKHKTPVLSILLIGILSIISVFLGQSMLLWISNAASFSCCLAYCMVSISFLKIRKRYPELERPYKIKHYKLVGVIAITMSSLMCILYLIPNSGCTFTIQEIIIIIIWIIIGIVFALFSKLKYKNLFGVIKN